MGKALAMFLNFTVNHFRSFESATLDDLGKTTAFIGRNAAGKSNLLHALEVLGRLTTGTDLGRYASTTLDRWGKSPSFTAEVALAEGRYRYSLSVTRTVVRPAPGKRPILQLLLTEQLDWADLKGRAASKPLFTRTKDTISLPEGQPDIRTGYDTPALVALSSLLPADSPVRKLTEPLRRFFSRIRYYPLDEPARVNAAFRVIEGSAYNEWANEYRRTSLLADPVPAQLLHLALTSEEGFSELRDRLGMNGLRLLGDITVREITAEEDEPPHLDPNTGLLNADALYEVAFYLGNEEPAPLRSFDQLSQGTRRLVRLLAAMSFGDSSVMLVEHPEDGIHRGLLRKVMGLFTTGFCPSQIFLSTHSDTVLNGLEPDAIRFVSAEDGRSSVRKMTPAERAAASLYIDSDVEGTLAEFAHSIEG